MSHLQYLRYLLRHKWYVFVAGLGLRVPLWRLIIHDWSKFMPQEWFAYAAFFYGKRAKLKDTEPDDYRYWTKAAKYYVAFDRAWLHHQHYNKHHYQHWILRNDDGVTKLLEMPKHFAREMVADWAGAGRAITGKWEVAAWYAKNREKIQLDDRTRNYVESLLKMMSTVMEKDIVKDEGGAMQQRRPQ